MRVEAALDAGLVLVERRDQDRDVVELRQLLVGAHADDGAQRQAVALDEAQVHYLRNVLRLAKQLASLDVLCKGRLLVTLVPGLTYAPEREAIGVDPKQRGAFIDEALPKNAVGKISKPDLRARLRAASASSATTDGGAAERSGRPETVPQPGR